MKRAKKQKTKQREYNYTGEQVRRHPRPMGLTAALIGYHQSPPTQKQEVLTKIKQLLINQWSANNLQLNNRTYNYNDMSAYLQIPIQTLMMQSQKQIMRIAGLMDEKGLKDLTRATFFRALFSAAEIQSLAQSQLANLMADQGPGYKPFVSSEVNKALANLISAQKPTADLIKIAMGGPTTNILITNTSVDKQSNTFIGTDEAVQLIRSNQQSYLDDPSLLSKLENLDDVPNINARSQDLSSIGLKNAADSGQPLITYPNASQEGATTADRHRKRAKAVGDEVLDGFEDVV